MSKNLKFAVIGGFLSFWGASFGAVSLDVQAGVLRSSTTAVIADSAIWVIVYDENGDKAFPGGLVENSSLSSGDSNQAYSDFFGVSIVEGGVVGGDRILRVFEVDSEGGSGVPGVAARDLGGIDLVSEGIAPEGLWAIYWFPALTMSSATIVGSSFEIGGFQQSDASLASGGDIGMKFPASNSGTFAAYFNDSGIGGDIPISSFTAIVAAVPEPASLLLSSFGVFALLRRRR